LNEVFLLCFQSSAARPQGGATKDVQMQDEVVLQESRGISYFAAFSCFASRLNRGRIEKANVQIWGKPLWARISKECQDRPIPFDSPFWELSPTDGFLLFRRSSCARLSRPYFGI
jgi:hypothetical protein